MNQTYTVKQVAQILGYSTNSIYTFLKEKRIKGVRVGKGRFRIPQSELDRLLTGSKKNLATVTSVQPVTKTLPVMPLSAEKLNESVIRVDVPSLFDWFIGLSGLMLGLSMFLFTRSFEEFSALAIAVWLPVIRTALIAGGIGVILSDITGKGKTIWHTVFQVILTGSFISLALAQGMMRNWDSVFLYTLLALLIGVSVVTQTGGVKMFAFFASASVILIPLCLILNRQPLT